MTNLLNLLIKWYIKNKRELPWRQTTDPYKIWLSEIILQQTRVEQGAPYYEKFVAKYPNIRSLANANDDEVMKLWQGLGYYSRARNMLISARHIQTEFEGIFPATLEAIKKLKGIGDYTAAAIGSFAFNIKEPVLDGNVYRFITRLYGIETPLDTMITKKTVKSILYPWISETEDPATFNQAIMEFGAIHCTKHNPKCVSCPFLAYCYAYKENKVTSIPVKGKAIKTRNRFFNYVIFRTKKNKIYIKKRVEKDIWTNLYDFPLIESTRAFSISDLKKDAQFIDWIKGNDIQAVYSSETLQHKLSHQNLYVTFLVVDISKFLNLKNSPIFDIEINTINSFAVPRVIENFLHGNFFKSLLKTF